MRGLTAKQQAVFGFISNHIAYIGYPPTVAEIAANFGYKSNNAAQDHINRLKARGLLTYEPGGRRTIRVAAHKPRALSLEELAAAAADDEHSEVTDAHIVDAFVEEFGGTRTDAAARLRCFTGIGL